MSRRAMLTLVVILSAGAVAAAATPPAAAGTAPAALSARVPLYLDGKALQATGMMSDGVVHVPLRPLAEALNLSVRWDASARAVNLRSKASRNPVAAAPVRLTPPTPPASAGPAPDVVAYVAAARKALEPLRDVQSLLRVGMTYDEYRGRIGEARIAVDHFLRAEATDPAAPSRTRLGDAMDSFQVAVAMWSGQVSCEAQRKATDSETIGKLWADCEARFKQGAQDRWAAAAAAIADTEAALAKAVAKPARQNSP